MMDLLERLRVFSPDVLYTLPYFSWERLALLVFSTALMFAFIKSLAPWAQSAIAFSRILPLSRPYQRIRIDSFNAGRVYFASIFAPLAGGILGSALLFAPDQVMTLIEDGFLDFTTLDAGSWALIVSSGLMIWLGLSILIFGLLSYGLLVGLVDAAIFACFALSAFLAGWALGPLSLLAFLKVRKYGDHSTGVFGHLAQFFVAPFHGLRELCLPKAALAGQYNDKPVTRSPLSIRDALKALDSDE